MCLVSRRSKRSLVPISVLELGAGDPTANGSSTGGLKVLPVGPLPPNPAEFIGTRALAELLAGLEPRAELILVDAPPILNLSDTMTLSARVDGLVVITRLPFLKRSTLHELHRALEASPATKLGFVLTGTTGTDTDGGYGYGYGYGHGQPSGRKPTTWETSA